MLFMCDEVNSWLLVSTGASKNLPLILIKYVIFFLFFSFLNFLNVSSDFATAEVAKRCPAHCCKALRHIRGHGDQKSQTVEGVQQTLRLK